MGQGLADSQKRAAGGAFVFLWRTVDNICVVRLTYLAYIGPCNLAFFMSFMAKEKRNDVLVTIQLLR